MLLDLTSVPFTRNGSYTVISFLTDKFKVMGKHSFDEGLYLRSVRGWNFNPIIGRLIPTKDRRPVKYEYNASPTEIKIITDSGEIRICFADKKTLLFKGKGTGIGLRLELLPDNFTDDYVHEIPYNGRTYYLVNLLRIQDKFVMSNQLGNIEIVREAEEKNSPKIYIDFYENDGNFLAAIEEARIEWDYRDFNFDYEKCLNEVMAEFSAFEKSMPEVADQYKNSRKLASYINWCSEVEKDGLLTRNAVYPSNNWMTGVFSWDHCFTAMALSYHNPELAWNQFMIMFDYQDESGRIPDCVDDVKASWNYCKPPIHGWTLMKMMEHMTLTEKQMKEAYLRLKKWTEWWYSYRDNDHDGVCEYYHGNDSGWDNSTVFSDNRPIESPDLSAYLVLQMEALDILAKKLNLIAESNYWGNRAQKQLRDMLKHCFAENKPVAVTSRTHDVIKSDSLLPYQSIVLGKRLPEKIAKEMINDIKNGGFVTEYGVATEKITSRLYRADGYWRGPIWSPSTVILLDGMYQLGEKSFVKETAEKFAKLVEKSGFSENYNALTGEANRDRAFTWTASGFLIMLHEYLLE